MTEEPVGTWLCPKCSPNASFYVKQLVKKRAASLPHPKTGKLAASKSAKGKESQSTSAKAATTTPTTSKDKAQKQEANTKNEDGKSVKKGVAMKKPAQKKPKPKWQGWVELPSDEEEEMKRKIDAEWGMEDAVVGKRRRSVRHAAEETETSSHGLRPRVGGLRPRVEKKEVAKTDSSASSVRKESSDEDGSVYKEDVDEEEEEDEDEGENEEESPFKRRKSVTGIFSNDFFPDTNMEDDEDEEEQSENQEEEEEDDSDNDEATPGSSHSSPAASPQTPSILSISSTSPHSSYSDTMDVDEDGDITPRQSDYSGAETQTPSPSTHQVNDDDEHHTHPPSPSEDSSDYMDITQDEISSTTSCSSYHPPSNPENDNNDIISIPSATPTPTPHSTNNQIDLTSPQSTPTPSSPLVIILRSPYSSSSSSPEEDPIFVTVTPAVHFNPHADSYPNRVEFLDNFPDSADRSTLPRLG